MIRRLAAAGALALAAFNPNPGDAQPVSAPGGFAPLHAIGFGGVGSAATAVDAAHPLPATDPNNSAFFGVTALAAGGTAYPAGRSTQAECTAAGTVTYTFADGSARTVPLQVGLNILPYAVTAWSGATATCTYANLK